jgi:GNAT superfamily N-acetyltransferase/heme-degrading monooxygenase HmoA
MIARHWKGVAKREDTERYIHHLRTDTFPQLGRIEGFIDASILKRAVDQGVEFLIVTRWKSIDAIKQFAGESPAAAVVPPVVHAMMVEYDPFVTHYEIDAGDAPREITLSTWLPGGIGRIVELHGTYYARYWNLGQYFEAKVAHEIGEFFNRFDPGHDGAWFAHIDHEVVGGIFIDGSRADSEGARLRWFIIDPQYHGLGAGNRLMNAAMEFCKRKQFPRVYLTTFSGLSTARHLYEKYDFRLLEEKDGSHLTGLSSLTEQVFEWRPRAMQGERE